MNNVKGYRIDVMNRTVSITKDFARLAQDPNTQEYALYTKFIRDGLRITKRTSRANGGFKSNRNLTYENMETYIMVQADHDNLMIEFASVKAQSKGQISPYNFVKEWFFETFPNYNDIPIYINQAKVAALSAPDAPEKESVSA